MYWLVVWFLVFLVIVGFLLLTIALALVSDLVTGRRTL